MYLKRETEGAIQGSDVGQVMEVLLWGKRQRDVVAAPVPAGVHVAGRIHGVAVGYLWSVFPVRRYHKHTYAGRATNARLTPHTPYRIETSVIAAFMGNTRIMHADSFSTIY